MTCKIMSYAVHYQGRAVSRSMCETHDFDLNQTAVSPGMMCPIGRVEKAIEDGLAKIAAALGSPV